MSAPVQLALYQPDIPQNTGTILRTCACLNVPAHVIEPCGFAFGEKALRRAGMDYLAKTRLTRHESWEVFRHDRPQGRLVLLTTKGACRIDSFQFELGDMLLFGRESAGVPEQVHGAADQRVRIPMAPDTRSLNLAVSAAMVLSTALTQLGAFPIDTVSGETLDP